MGYSGTSSTITSAQISDAVWDEAHGDHTTAGSTGQQIALVSSRMPDQNVTTTTSYVSRTSSSQGTTVTFTPSAGTAYDLTLLLIESAPDHMPDVSFSADSGSTYSDRFSWNQPYLLQTVDSSAVNGGIPVGPTSRFKYVTPATSGTYIIIMAGQLHTTG